MAHITPPEALAICAEFGVEPLSYWGENLAYAFDEGRKFGAAHPTPDRSGEADKTGTGLAEGESGLPEGSS